MAATAHYSIIKTDHHVGDPGEGDSLLLEIAYDDDPVASVTVEWHGDLELEIKVTKYFGGKTPGIVTAMELHQLVTGTIAEQLEPGSSDFGSVFKSDDRLLCSWHTGTSDKADIQTLPSAG